MPHPNWYVSREEREVHAKDAKGPDCLAAQPSLIDFTLEAPAALERVRRGCEGVPASILPLPPLLLSHTKNTMNTKEAVPGRPPSAL